MLSLKYKQETFAKSIKKIIKIITVSSLLIVAISACEKKGSIEKSGKSADQAIEDAGEAIENAGDKVKKETSK